MTFMTLFGHSPARPPTSQKKIQFPLEMVKQNHFARKSLDRANAQNTPKKYIFHCKSQEEHGNTRMCKGTHKKLCECNGDGNGKGVDKGKGGKGGKGKPDDQSDIFSSPRQIRQLTVGDVVLLKGESWHGNEGRGAVHRSPPMPSGAARLMLSLDFE